MTSDPEGRCERTSGSTSASRGATAGIGHLVVLLHGQPGDPEIWDGVQELLAGHGLRLLAVDRPGYGSSQLEPGGFRHNAAELIRLIEDRGGPAIVVAHSWAAAPALMAARRSPELIDGLVLCAPVGDPDSVTLVDRLLGRTMFGRALLRLGLALGGWLGARPGGDRLLSAAGLGRLDRSGARVATRPARDRRARRAAAIEQTALLEELVDVRRAASSVATPTVVIAGNHDGVVPPGAVGRLARTMPHARSIEVDGGHLVPVEHPSAVADAVLALVGESGPA
jgi:pimeloyl-ACP methyl ester carboxylesterase